MIQHQEAVDQEVEVYPQDNILGKLDVVIPNSEQQNVNSNMNTVKICSNRGINNENLHEEDEGILEDSCAKAPVAQAGPVMIDGQKESNFFCEKQQMTEIISEKGGKKEKHEVEQLESFKNDPDAKFKTEPVVTPDPKALQKIIQHMAIQIIEYQDIIQKLAKSSIKGKKDMKKVVDDRRILLKKNADLEEVVAANQKILSSLMKQIVQTKKVNLPVMPFELPEKIEKMLAKIESLIVEQNSQLKSEIMEVIKDVIMDMIKEEKLTSDKRFKISQKGSSSDLEHYIAVKIFHIAQREEEHPPAAQPFNEESK